MMRSVYSYFLLLFASIAIAQTPPDIFEVARKGSAVQAAKILKDDPAAVNAKSPEGFSPLILACYRGNRDVANYLIKHGADVNVASTMGTALMAAVVKNDVETVKLLLAKEANVELSDSNGITALIYAVKFQNPEIVKLLLKSGASKSARDKDGKTAFEYAVFSGNQNIIELLK